MSEKTKLIYIGPSLPGENLRNAQILTGTEEEIEHFIGRLRESYPEIKYLLFPPDKLAEAQRKVQKKGNILHKYFKDVEAKARTFRKKGRK